MVRFKRQPVVGQPVTVYSTARAFLGVIDEISGTISRVDDEFVLRRSSIGLVLMKLDGEHLFQTREEAIRAGRWMLKAEAARFKQMARELR